LSGWDAHEFTAAAGTRVHAAVLGPPDAPEVVCVHGLGCSYRYWLPFARALAPHARTVAVDLPGFGRTPGPYQHFAQARLRAVEEGLPLVRAANTGISAVVDPYGRLVGSLPLSVEGVLDADLPVAISRTVYGRTGIFPLTATLMICLMALIVRRRRRSFHL